MSAPELPGSVIASFNAANGIWPNVDFGTCLKVGTTVMGLSLDSAAPTHTMDKLLNAQVTEAQVDSIMDAMKALHRFNGVRGLPPPYNSDSFPYPTEQQEDIAFRVRLNEIVTRKVHGCKATMTRFAQEVAPKEVKWLPDSGYVFRDSNWDKAANMLLGEPIPPPTLALYAMYKVALGLLSQSLPEARAYREDLVSFAQDRLISRDRRTELIYERRTKLIGHFAPRMNDAVGAEIERIEAETGFLIPPNAVQGFLATNHLDVDALTPPTSPTTG